MTSPLYAVLRARRLTVTAAAQACDLTQPALSRYALGSRRLPEEWADLLAPLGLAETETAAVAAWQAELGRGRPPVFRLVRRAQVA